MPTPLPSGAARNLTTHFLPLPVIKPQGEGPFRKSRLFSLYALSAGPGCSHCGLSVLVTQHTCTHTFAHTRPGSGTHSFPWDWGLPTYSGKFPHLAIHFAILASQWALGLWGRAGHISLSSKGLSRAQAQSVRKSLTVTGEGWREISTSLSTLQNVPSAHQGGHLPGLTQDKKH